MRIGSSLCQTPTARPANVFTFLRRLWGSLRFVAAFRRCGFVWVCQAVSGRGRVGGPALLGCQFHCTNGTKDCRDCTQRGWMRRTRAEATSAAAETEDLTVLHYDADFDLIASVTGKRCEWIVPRGSIDRDATTS